MRLQEPILEFLHGERGNFGKYVGKASQKALVDSMVACLKHLWGSLRREPASRLLVCYRPLGSFFWKKLPGQI